MTSLADYLRSIASALAAGDVSLRWHMFVPSILSLRYLCKNQREKKTKTEI